MLRDKRILVVVPDRERSKGITLENLQSVGGVPMVDQVERVDYYDPAGAKITTCQQLQSVHHRNSVTCAISRHCQTKLGNIKGEKDLGRGHQHPVGQYRYTGRSSLNQLSTSCFAISVPEMKR
jgi:hypothetical protein